MTKEAYLELTVVLSSPTPTSLSLHFAHSGHGFLSLLIYLLLSYFRELPHDLLLLGISFLPPLHLLSLCPDVNPPVLGLNISSQGSSLCLEHTTLSSFTCSPILAWSPLFNRHHPDSSIHSTRARTMLVLLLTISLAFSTETTKSIPTKCW